MLEYNSNYSLQSKMTFSIATIILVFGLSLACYALYYLLLKPLHKLKFYEKQGLPMRYFPVIGNYKACIDGQNSHSDFYWSLKQQVKANPKLKALGGNLIDTAQIYLIDPETITAFYKQQDKYTKSTAGLDMFKLFIGDGLVTTDGEFWKRHRKVISATFHYDFLKKIIPDIGQIANQLLEGFKQKNIEEMGIMAAFESITGEVVGRLFFGTKFSEYHIEGEAVTSFMSRIGARIGAEIFSTPYLLFGTRVIRMGILPRHSKLMEDLNKFNSFVKTIIEPRIEAIRGAKSSEINDDTSCHNLLDSLIKNSDFTSQEIYDEFVTFFAAGTDTTGHLLGLAAYYLSKNPQYKTRLIEEAEKYIGEPSEITVETLNKMEFTTAFLKETLRCATPAAAFVDRVALQDHSLGDLRIKKGTLVNIAAIGPNYNPNFHDNEEIFDPERWITDSKTMKSIAQNPAVFLPFSAGSHNCIGQHLAMNEARIIFSMFVKKYDLLLSPDYDHRMTLRLTHEPVNKLNFKLIPRK